MSIRLRLSLIYTGVLVLVFFIFGLVVYARARATLVQHVDLTLQEAAEQIVEPAQAYMLGQETVITFPEDGLDVFQRSGTFIVVLNAEGEVVSSSNPGTFDAPLDPGGLRDENTFSTVSLSGRKIRVLTAPLYAQNRLIGYLQVGRVLEGYDATLNSLRWTLLLAGWAAVTLSLLLEDLLSHYSLKPLYDLIDLASHITRADDLSRRLPDTGRNDEFGRLTAVFNETLQRLEQLFRTQQRLLADVSHELRTPLTTIRGNVDLMRRIGVADAESLNAIQEETERMTRLVDDLLFLAKADAGSLPLERVPVDLGIILSEVYHQVRRLEHGVEIVMRKAEHVVVEGDADRLKQLILNLVNNAIKYTPIGSQVFISVTQVGRKARLVVADTGRGIPPDDLPHIFQRFYRVDKARARVEGGAGLGLAIVKWIVQAHEGEIQASSELGKGTTFTVWLPVMPAVALEADGGEEDEPRELLAREM